MPKRLHPHLLAAVAFAAAWSSAGSAIAAMSPSGGVEAGDGFTTARPTAASGTSPASVPEDISTANSVSSTSATGAAPKSSVTVTIPAGSPGGTRYGTPLARAARRPRAAVFTVSPLSVVAGAALPALTVKVDQTGVASVRARIVLWPVKGRGAVVRLELGTIATGTVLHPAWPIGTTLAPGRYRVRLHAVAPGGATLLRRSGATGRSTLRVAAPPLPDPEPISPLTATVAPVTPAVPPPAPTAEGVFPVAGAHSLGTGENRFGAGRTGHIHEGQDILAAEGLPVVAPVAGTISARDTQPAGAGFYLVEDTADGRSFFFAHCKADSFAVTLGQAVTAGQQLCLVGSTGSATTPHLHFEQWVGGWRRDSASAPVDPLPQLLLWDR
jgi:murein DD-endopeptidase MepM/ murein hydrolase activator NlpD